MSGAGGRALWGLLAEFRTPAELVHAAEAVRDAGFSKWDCHAPFPVHGLDGAMGIKPTKLPWVVLGAGLTGCFGGFLMQWWMNAYDYRVIISGKPFWSIPANVPVAFELTILLSALTAFGGMLAFNGLPQWFHPLLRNARFKRTTDDRFFISIEATDPRFDVEATEKLLRDAGSLHVEWIEE
ncbi:MAG TPA: DUF3341 domain-containing protein [Candidatus Polarisedimenticolaceae bacterium]